MQPSRAAESRCREALQRFVDLAFAAVGLPLLSPLLASIALAIHLDDGSPVFFGQTRIGRNGKRFRICKFRTMRADATGPSITAYGDGRVTRVGAVLRRFKLDELPQLFNVLNGDMSVVGPRPEVPEYVQQDATVWQKVLGVRPGITDVATLVFRNEEELLAAAGDTQSVYRERILPAKLALNLDYLASRTLWTDLKLILMTIYYSLLPRGFKPELVQRTFLTGAGHD